MPWKLVAILSCSLLLIFLVVAVLYIAFGGVRFGHPESALIVNQVQRLNQLATVKYTLQRVVSFKEPKEPIGEESILLMVQGQAVGGVDLAALKSDDIVFLNATTVNIALPPSKLLNVFLDEDQVKVWDHHVTWWTPWVPYDPELEHHARLSALDDLRSAALRMGILSDARQNAQTAIQDLLGTLHLNVKFETHPSL